VQLSPETSQNLDSLKGFKNKLEILKSSSHCAVESWRLRKALECRRSQDIVLGCFALDRGQAGGCEIGLLVSKIRQVGTVLCCAGDQSQHTGNCWS
jgi:hypothetical protein